MADWIISSSVLIVFVIAIRYFFRGKLAMRAWYGLWLVVAVRLLVPISFVESDLSILNLFRFGESGDRQETDKDPEKGQNGWMDQVYSLAGTHFTETGTAGAVEPLESQKVSGSSEEDYQGDTPIAGMLSENGNEQSQWRGSGVENMTAKDNGSEGKLSMWMAKGGAYSVLWYLWILGVILSAGGVALLNRRYQKRVYRSRKQFRAGTKKELPVYVSAVVDSPCMFGMFHPAVYLSREAAKEQDALPYVLCHENVHYRHGDNWWVVVRAACLCLHWYNPLVWVAAALSEQDGELACDERTLELLGQDERIRYGRALLDFCAKGSVWQRGWKLSTAMSRGKKLLKERLLVIVGEPRRHAGAMAAVMLLTALCSVVTFTGKASGKELERENPTKGYEETQDASHGEGETELSPGDGQDPKESNAECNSIVSIDLNDGEEYTLKISGEAILGSGAYQIHQIQLNQIQGREEEILQIIRPEDVRVLYTRALEDIKNGNGQMYSYAPEGEPLYAKALCTAEDLPAREVARFLADENGELFSDAPDGKVVVVDLNFDGYQDFCIQSGTGTVNTPYYCYLWNPQQRRFEPSYMIPNVEVDKEAKLIRSATKEGNGKSSVKYYGFDGANMLHMVRYVEENLSPEAVFPTLDLTYCETSYGLPAIDEWDYGTRYGGALPERFVYWAKEALTELYQWSGTRIDKACFTMTSFGSVSFGNTPEQLNASLVYYDRGYGAKAGFQDLIEQMGVATERTVWFSPVIQWNKPENLNEMLDIQLVEWYFERSPLSEGEKFESAERYALGIYTIKAESGRYYQIFLNDATRELSAMYGPYESRPD